MTALVVFKPLSSMLSTMARAAPMDKFYNEFMYGWSPPFEGLSDLFVPEMQAVPVEDAVIAVRRAPDGPVESQPKRHRVEAPMAAAPALKMGTSWAQVQARREILPLDGLQDGAIRCFNMQLFASDHATHMHGGLLRHWADGTLFAGFFGLAPPQAVTRIFSDAKWAPHFDQMLGATKHPLLVRQSHPLCYMRYFAVPKTEETLRAIGSATDLNDILGKPPGLSLISIRHLVSIILMWDEVHFAEADQRAAYYSYPLGDSDRQYVSVQRTGDPQPYSFAALVMGVSVAPYLQSVVAELFCTCPALRKKFELCPGPGWWSLRQKDANGRVPREAPIAAIIAPFYDNFGIFSPSAETTSTISTAIEVFAEKYGVVWKGKSATSPAFKQSKNVGDFIGIHFERHGDEVHVRHLDKNVHNWEKIRLSVGTVTLGNVTEICGLLTWDNSLHLRSARESISLRQIQSEVMHQASTRGTAWRATRASLSPEQLQFLESSLRRLVVNVPSVHRKDLSPVEHRVSVSDASMIRGSGFRLYERGRGPFVRRPWLGVEEEKWPIHVKELVAAIETIDSDLRGNPPPANTRVHYTHLIDNKTAISGLTKECMIDEVGHQWLCCIARWKAMGVVVDPVYINTKEMPADEDSRLQETSDDKCARAFQFANQVSKIHAGPLGWLPKLRPS